MLQQPRPPVEIGPSPSRGRRRPDEYVVLAEEGDPIGRSGVSLVGSVNIGRQALHRTMWATIPVCMRHEAVAGREVATRSRPMPWRQSTIVRAADGVPISI